MDKKISKIIAVGVAVLVLTNCGEFNKNSTINTAKVDFVKSPSSTDHQYRALLPAIDLEHNGEIKLSGCQFVTIRISATIPIESEPIKSLGFVGFGVVGGKLPTGLSIGQIYRTENENGDFIYSSMIRGILKEPQGGLISASLALVQIKKDTPSTVLTEAKEVVFDIQESTSSKFTFLSEKANKNRDVSPSAKILVSDVCGGSTIGQYELQNDSILRYELFNHDSNKIAFVTAKSVFFGASTKLLIADSSFKNDEKNPVEINFGSDPSFEYVIDQVKWSPKKNTLLVLTRDRDRNLAESEYSKTINNYGYTIWFVDLETNRASKVISDTANIVGPNEKGYHLTPEFTFTPDGKHAVVKLGYFPEGKAEFNLYALENVESPKRISFCSNSKLHYLRKYRVLNSNDVLFTAAIKGQSIFDEKLFLCKFKGFDHQGRGKVLPLGHHLGFVKSGAWDFINFSDAVSPDQTSMIILFSNSSNSSERISAVYKLDLNSLPEANFNPVVNELDMFGYKFDGSFSWSPDSKKIGFIAKTKIKDRQFSFGFEDDITEKSAYERSAVFYVELDHNNNSKAFQIPKLLRSKDAQPESTVDDYAKLRWSPNGRYLAYLSDERMAKRMEINVVDFAVSQSDPNRIRKVYFNQGAHIIKYESLQWSKNSRWLAFLADPTTSNKYELYVFDFFKAKDSTDHSVFKIRAYSGPEFINDGYYGVFWAEDGTRLFFATKTKKFDGLSLVGENVAHWVQYFDKDNLSEPKYYNPVNLYTPNNEEVISFEKYN